MAVREPSTVGGALPLRNMLRSSADDVWFWSIRTACKSRSRSSKVGPAAAAGDGAIATAPAFVVPSASFSESLQQAGNDQYCCAQACIQLGSNLRFFKNSIASRIGRIFQEQSGIQNERNRFISCRFLPLFVSRKIKPLREVGSWRIKLPQNEETDTRSH